MKVIRYNDEWDSSVKKQFDLQEEEKRWMYEVGNWFREFFRITLGEYSTLIRKGW